MTIAYVSENDSNESLTPYHLIYRRNIFQKTLQNIPKNSKTLPRRAKYLQTLINCYWNKFISKIKNY